MQSLEIIKETQQPIEITWDLATWSFWLGMYSRQVLTHQANTARIKEYESAFNT